MNEEREKTVIRNVRIPKSLDDKLKAIADYQGKTVSQLLRRDIQFLVKEYILNVSEHHKMLVDAQKQGRTTNYENKLEKVQGAFLKKIKDMTSEDDLLPMLDFHFIDENIEKGYHNNDPDYAIV